MHVKTFLLIGAALGVGYGVAFLLVPGLVIQVYGGTQTLPVLLGYRYFGVALLTVGLVIWAIRDCRDPAILQGVLLGHGVADMAGIAVSLWGTLTGALNGLGWFNVVLYLALLAGCVYFYRGTTQSTRLAV